MLPRQIVTDNEIKIFNICTGRENELSEVVDILLPKLN